MVTVRKSIATLLSAALIWLGVASAIIVTSVGGARHSEHWKAHAQFVLNRQLGAHKHAGHGAGHHALMSDEKAERECAAACLDTVADKLLPSAVTVKPPEVELVLSTEISIPALLAPLEFAHAYLPAGPPGDPASAKTGAARLLARNSHLRI